MARKVVIALGGNALGKTPKQQLELVRKTAGTIVDLIEEGCSVVVTHGNGSQVGMVHLAFETAHSKTDNAPEMPLAECGAMTQGYIGYHLQQSIYRELEKRGLHKPVATVITQVEVSADDEAFHDPEKPIGSFYTKEEAEEISASTGYIYKEDAGRGYRRVVASPLPLNIVELPVIKQLVKGGTVVITVGGGGIPVIKEEGGYKGVDAVIDKDRASSLLARYLKADMLVILTTVEKVCINFNKPDQKQLDEMSLSEAHKHIADRQFAPGSMLPKVEACLDFVEHTADGKALITSLEKAKEALQGKTGTLIHR